MGKKLSTYRKKRDFDKTAEPRGVTAASSKRLRFVIQKHAATHLHFDFRIEIGGVLKSWAIPKGVSLTPSVKRLAMLTEDHPMAYANFEGIIHEGEYGAGVVMIWDYGSYKNIKTDKDGKPISMKKCFEMGRIEIELKGKKLQGAFALIRFRDEKHWLCIKMRDEHASTKSVVSSRDKSAKSGKTMLQIKRGSS